MAGQSPGSPDVRLGLLATDLGLDPVPGAQPSEYGLLDFVVQNKARGNHV